ncbi:MAG TPA: DUF2851 family protein [Chthoniobacterales bacterium]|nr:DUF2851 family protein [Chthoniobacterales bacterium]
MNLDAIYQEVLRSEQGNVRESDSDLGRAWSELEYQALWYSGAFGSTFRATNGSSIEILEFGFWNKEAGPDFVNALIRVNGIETLAGDIELDLSPADWERHLHGENPAFRNVILHVLARRSGPVSFTRTIEHREILQVELTQDYRFAIIETEIDLAKPGACCGPLARFAEQEIDQILETAARLRLERKTQLLRRAIHIHGIDEALFQALAIALGYKWNKVPFLILAQRVTLQRLRRDSEAAEAILFGLAGFLESAEPSKNLLPASHYAASLWAYWWKVRGELHSLVLTLEHWKLGGSRPANHAHRRLGALAVLASRWLEFRKQSNDLPTVCRWFEGLSHPFWDFHYTLHSDASPAPIALLGKTRVKEVLANVLFPLVAFSGTADWEAYKHVRAELGNKHLELAGIRLFGDQERARTHTRFLFQQQGLLQIFEDFCLANRNDCRECRFPRLIDSLVGKD